jgi:hypothetical protein
MIITLLLSLSAFSCPPGSHDVAHAATPAAKKESFGKGITSAEAPILLSDALKRSSELAGKEIVVKAEVDQVCQSKGCWLTLKEGPSQVRVTFEAKRQAMVQGKIFEKELSPAEARHYAKDAGKPEAEIKKITTAQKEPRFEATGLVFTGKQL